MAAETKAGHEQDSGHQNQPVTWTTTYVDDPDPGPDSGATHWEISTCDVCGSAIQLQRPGAAPTE